MEKEQRLADPFLLFTLGLTLLAVASSCGPATTPAVVPKQVEEPVLKVVTPLPFLPPANKLVCPSVPSTDVVLPPVPYDAELGDCALIGKSGEIEAWLTALEQIAASCQANREPNWADTLEARDALDAQVDQLIVGAEMITSCAAYGSSEPDEPGEDDPPSTHLYTNWLKTIGENTVKYCTMIDELIKPLSQACEEINYYQTCQATDPEQYHAIIESKMNAAQILYDYTDFFYTNTLQTFGWGNFKLYYDEASIDCPLVVLPVSFPTFTFSKNAFCRVGPSQAYKDVTGFLADQTVQIDGRNQDEPRWWWVLIPGTTEHCWVSDSTGSAAGPLEDTVVVAAPPLPPEPSPTPTRIHR